MNLYIAEKPSLAKAIVAALPKPHKKQNGYIEVGNGDIVSWCIGHILEQAEPQVYDSKYQKWHFEHLPIEPQTWQLVPKKTSKTQLTILTRLIKKASAIIHAGDPDREGQLLVDEVINYVNIPDDKKRSVQRLLINDLNLQAVKKALQNLKSNQDFMPLSVSALARSRADWLYGINLTRALTIRGQKSGFNAVLSVGRVQTPVLGLVVERDQQIADFTPHDYYEVLAKLATSKGEQFSAKWQPSQACEPHMDSEQRIINKALAEHVITRITDQQALVTKAENKDKKQAPPLPYNLSALQIDAAKRFSMNAKLVLDICQVLYEKHQLITYPRSDCRFLPTSQFGEAKQIIAMLSQAEEPLAKAASQADASIKSKAWNNAKVSAHHAIIPTLKSVNSASLNNFEKNVYQLICRQYLAQFYPHFQFNEIALELDIAGGLFSAKSTKTQNLGWKQLFNANNEEKEQLPLLNKGDVLHCGTGELITKATQPPKPFTDATLLGAMTNIARFVQNPEIKKQLKETDGLGTEATRAGIIDLLFKRQYLKRQGKSIHASDLGRGFVQALPKETTLPDMTAHWESSLNLMTQKQCSYQAFMSGLSQQLHQLIDQASTIRFTDLPKIDKPSFKKRKRHKATTNKKAKTMT
ncbi:DNA topoisomerase III [Thalassotalea sp. LPB0316]|uniref:DNA topoisomerase III n=1 Tax=Thalassotalea sp. LPB0316 TaxID=2769490 RepID=UPI001868B559|nr:DNA topoisomerase III [Thalassotalea sp. LPB0316]QOL25849.1 DNA topoisomerase III [Thalassotalea sp. LPB0316]